MTLVAMAFIQPGPSAFEALIAIFGLSALFVSGSTVAYYALMADIVDYDTLRSGCNNAGNYYALITFVPKGGAGCGCGCVFDHCRAIRFRSPWSERGLGTGRFLYCFYRYPDSPVPAGYRYRCTVSHHSPSPRDHSPAS